MIHCWWKCLCFQAEMFAADLLTVFFLVLGVAVFASLILAAQQCFGRRPRR